jgi:Domain of unknown function (DUF397)
MTINKGGDEMSNLDQYNVTWRKSSHSQGNGACVEISFVPGATGIRDSKDPDGGHLSVDQRPFASFLRRVKTGRLDRP